MDIRILENEYWWGPTVFYGNEMPFDINTNIKIDLGACDAVNQSMPLLLSSKGRYIWSEEEFCVEFNNGIISINTDNAEVNESGTNLREAYLNAMKNHFVFDGKELPKVFFDTAQYNGWIQFTYNPTQNGVLEYAHGIIDNGFKPGILIIDEGWHGRYGTWEFDRCKFPNPKQMIDELHELGFVVMLWVAPFVCPDGEAYVKSLNSGSETEKGQVNEDLYLRLDNGKVALIEWWNGTSAILDFTKQCDRDFLKKQLDSLMNNYGVDGFKFDGGALYHYSDNKCVNGHISESATPCERNSAWNELGRQYKYHEYKDSCRGGGKCMIQRLRDRNHSWTNNGINSILPDSFAQGLLGYPFICPDMIGGGEWGMFAKDGFVLDEELFVRMSELSTYFPMMQYSLAPWKCLSEENLNICKSMAKLHSKISDKIMKLINESITSGEPIIRHPAYVFPNEHFEKNVDFFMLGDDTLVAPVLIKGDTQKTLRLPNGRWKYNDETIYDGGQTVTVDADIATLPVFTKLSN